MEGTASARWRGDWDTGASLGRRWDLIRGVGQILGDSGSMEFALNGVSSKALGKQGRSLVGRGVISTQMWPENLVETPALRCAPGLLSESVYWNQMPRGPGIGRAGGALVWTPAMVGWDGGGSSRATGEYGSRGRRWGLSVGPENQSRARAPPHTCR